VRQQPPLDHEKVKARRIKTVALVCPHLALANLGQNMVAMGSAARNLDGQKQKATGSKPGKAAGGTAATGTDSKTRQPARFQGVLCCYGFNSAKGCTRLPPGVTVAKTCKDGSNTVFVHRCNAFVNSRVFIPIHTPCVSNIQPQRRYDERKKVLQIS